MPKGSTSSGVPTGVFRYSPGSELSSPERQMLRAQNAGSALVSALEAEPSWWGYVRTVRESRDSFAAADRLCKRYAPRARRKPIRELMLACAGAPDQRHAVMSMCGLLTATCTVPHEGNDRRKIYAMGEAFMLSVLRGATELAARGRAAAVVQPAADEDVRRVLDLAGPTILAAAERRRWSSEG